MAVTPDHCLRCLKPLAPRGSNSLDHRLESLEAYTTFLRTTVDTRAGIESRRGGQSERWLDQILS